MAKQAEGRRGHRRERALLTWSAVLLALLLTEWAAAPASLDAQRVTLPDSTEVTAITAGRLIDGTDGRVRENVTIVVRGTRLEAVGEDVQIPSGATRIDLSGHTVMPGFIDLHTHLTSGGGSRDNRLRRWPGHLAIVGVMNARITLEAGFTTVRNVGADNFADVALRDAINEGLVPGPRMYTAVYSLGITGGHCDSNGYRPDIFEEPGIEVGIAQGIERVREAVNYQIKYGADVIKFCATGGVLSLGDRSRRAAVHGRRDGRSRPDRQHGRAHRGRARPRPGRHQGRRARRRHLHRARVHAGRRNRPAHGRTRHLPGAHHDGLRRRSPARAGGNARRAARPEGAGDLSRFSASPFRWRCGRA